MNTEYWKIFGQHQATAVALFQLYVVPEGRQATVHSLAACNPSSTAVKITIWVCLSGHNVDGNHILVADLEVAPFTTWTFDRDLMLAKGDSIYVQSQQTGVIFSATGAEQYIDRAI